MKKKWILLCSREKNLKKKFRWKNIASLTVIAPALIILEIVHGSAKTKPIEISHREEFPFRVPLLQRCIFLDRYRKLYSKEQLQCSQQQNTPGFQQAVCIFYLQEVSWRLILERFAGTMLCWYFPRIIGKLRLEEISWGL